MIEIIRSTDELFKRAGSINTRKRFVLSRKIFRDRAAAFAELRANLSFHHLSDEALREMIERRGDALTRQEWTSVNRIVCEIAVIYSVREPGRARTVLHSVLALLQGGALRL